MFKQFRDKIALSGVTILIIGVALLIFTFISSYGFLTQNLSILPSTDVTQQTFNESLVPLIAAGIRVMYLAIMSWIGSLLTIRGITIISHLPEATITTPQKTKGKKSPLEEKIPEQSKEPIKSELKSAEPQLIVMPLSETSEACSQATEPKKNEAQTTS